MSKENTKEIWKDVVGYERYYQVSNLGNVRSCERTVMFGLRKRTVKSVILVKNTAGSNYDHVKLSKNNVIKRHYIHRMVAESFIENPENKTEVNHKNAEKRDNRVCNLEWVTPRENVEHYNLVIGNVCKKDIKHYETFPIPKYDFKKICEKRGVDHRCFVSVFSGEKYNGGTKRYYFFKEENYIKDIDFKK